MFKRNNVKEGTQGFVYLGGCGSNLGKRNILARTPTDYPNVEFLIGNTDARHLQHFFGEESGPQVAEWTTARRLEEFQIGNNEITKGNGSGADLEVGFRAIRNEKSYEKLSKFLAKHSMNNIVAGLGKGTGTTASQVAAEICQEHNKSENNDERKINTAVVVLPKGASEEAGVAIEAHKRITKLIPTVTIYNSKISAYAESLGPDKLKKFTLSDANDAIYDEVLRPLSDLYLENTLRTGEIANDQNDMKTALKRGHHLYLRDTTFSAEEAENLTPEEAASRLFKANFQRVDVAKSGEIALLWCVGYPYLFFDELQERIQNLATEYHPSRKSGFRIIPSYRADLNEGESGRIILMVVADEVRTSKEAAVSQAKRVAVPQFVPRPEIPEEYALDLGARNEEPALDHTLDLDSLPEPRSEPAVTRETASPKSWLRFPGLRRRQPQRDLKQIQIEREGKSATTARVAPEHAERYNRLVAQGKEASALEWQALEEDVFRDRGIKLERPESPWDKTTH